MQPLTTQEAGLGVGVPGSEFQQPSLPPYALAPLEARMEGEVEASGIALHHTVSVSMFTFIYCNVFKLNHL